MLQAHTLAQWAEGSWVGQPQGPIQGCHFDSRLLKPGQLFVALKTDKNDGHRYLAEALVKGARAALVETVDDTLPLAQLEVKDSLRAFQALARQYRQTFHYPVVGITGSYGKTSTKDALALLLQDRSPLKTELNFNNTLGLPYTLLQLNPAQHRLAVVEAGISQFQEMETLADILRPDVAIITNIFGQHLEGLKTVEHVALEKSKLLSTLKPGGLCVTTPSALAFDCFRCRKELIVVSPRGGFEATREHVFGETQGGIFRQTRERGGTKKNGRYTTQNDMNTQKNGINPKITDLYAQENVRSLQDTGHDMRYYETRVDVVAGCTYVRLEGCPTWKFPLVSRGILQNLVLASVVALEFGLNVEDIQERIAAWQPSPQRGEWIRIGSQVYYADCYNSGPVALADAMSYFRERVGKAEPRLYVLGAMHELGEASDAVHYTVGKTCAYQEKDQFLVIGKPAKPLQQGLLDQGVPGAQVTYLDSTEDARQKLEDFQGAIFLKGSHAYSLQSLLPSTGQDFDN